MPGSVPLPGYLAQVLLASGPSVSSTNLVVADNGDHKTFTVPLTSTRRYIDRSSTVTVQTSTDGGTTWSSTLDPATYSLRYQTAQVTLGTALSGGTTYQAKLVSFSYYAYAALLQATDITAQLTRAMLDSTTLQGASGTGWTSHKPGLLSGKFACKTWQLDTGATLYTGHLSGSDLLICSFMAPDGVHGYEGYCSLSDTNVGAAVNGLATEDVTFQIDGNVAIL